MKIKKQKNKEIVKNEKAITLVALVVTIIVLIILAAVAINLSFGENGIITKAMYAIERHKTEQVKEKLEMAILEIQTQETAEGRETTLDTLLANLPTKLLKIKISKNNNELKGIFDEYEFSINQNMKVTIIGEYTPITINDLKEGDYIKYNTDIDGIGVITCRVLYEADSQYGLQIITDKNITNIKLGEDGSWETGKQKYNSAIETLNQIAEDYINEKYIIDARCVGSLPTIDENGMMIYKNSESENEILKYTPSGWSTNDSGCKGLDENYDIDLKQMNKIKNNGIDIIGKEYWLASRSVNSQAYSCDFYVRYINASGVLDTKYLCGILEGMAFAFSDTTGFRACFSVRTDIEIYEGDGKTESSAYIIE